MKSTTVHDFNLKLKRCLLKKNVRVIVMITVAMNAKYSCILDYRHIYLYILFQFSRKIME